MGNAHEQTTVGRKQQVNGRKLRIRVVPSLQINRFLTLSLREIILKFALRATPTLFDRPGSAQEEVRAKCPIPQHAIASLEQVVLQVHTPCARSQCLGDTEIVLLGPRNSLATCCHGPGASRRIAPRENKRSLPVTTIVRGHGITPVAPCATPPQVELIFPPAGARHPAPQAPRKNGAAALHPGAYAHVHADANTDGDAIEHAQAYPGKEGRVSRRDLPGVVLGLFYVAPAPRD